MTLEQVQAMSDEELRIKVTELCGWKGVIRSGSWIVGWIEDEPSKLIEVPDYCEDLNAMHEAEQMLDTDGKIPLRSSVYLDCLADITGTTRMGLQQEIVMATARQRAEAFVLAMATE